MQTIRITTSQNIDIDYEVAGIGPRFIAYLIDGFILGCIGLLIVLTGIWSQWGKSSGNNFFIVIGIYGLLYACYDLICELFFNGQSIGKRTMKIKVISLDGGRPTLGQYLLRWLFRIVDFTITSGVAAIVAIAATDKKQRIGDLVAGTTLVRTHPKTKLNQVAFRPPLADYQVVYSQAARLTDQEITLIHEVLNNYRESENITLLFNTAQKIKQHLDISNFNKQSDKEFLETIVTDYNYLQVFND